MGINEDNYENLFKANYQLLHRFAVQYVHDVSTAEDICQKVFIRLWEKRDHLDPEQNLKSYLFTSVRNQCLNHIRDHKKFRSQLLDLSCIPSEDLATESLSLEAEELKRIIEEALSALPEKCQLVFRMSRFQQLKYHEIAEELAISTKTVEAHMTKAIKRLRSALAPYGFGTFLILLNLCTV